MLKTILKLLGIVVLCAWLTPAHALLDAVTLILSEDSGPYQEFVDRFRAAVPATGARATRISVLSLQKQTPNGDAIAPDTDLVVAVGVRATEAAIRMHRPVPILSVLVPRHAFMQLKKEYRGADGKLSAIYLDQPFSRRFALIREALPGRKQIGVVLGPDSAGDLHMLQSAAREHGLSIVTENISSQNELLPALKQVLGQSEVLLATPDSLVYNRTTAQSILLTSYRAQEPVIAYSQSYVSAGALAAVFSTPAQIAQQAAEMLRVAAAEASLPAPQYPKYFSVTVNRQVARSLGIEVEDDAALRSRLGAQRE